MIYLPNKLKTNLEVYSLGVPYYSERDYPLEVAAQTGPLTSIARRVGPIGQDSCDRQASICYNSSEWRPWWLDARFAPKRRVRQSHSSGWAPRARAAAKLCPLMLLSETCRLLLMQKDGQGMYQVPKYKGQKEGVSPVVTRR
jgi:hypothetical protein